LISRLFCLLFAPSYRLRKGVDVVPERLGFDKTNPFLRPRVLDVNGPYSILNDGPEQVGAAQSEYQYGIINSQPFRLNYPHGL